MDDLKKHIQELNKKRSGLLLTEDLTVWYSIGVETPKQFDEMMNKDYESQMKKGG